jgi:geranylgeranyl reductase family protein
MHSCDVLIIGGGPAGSSCAWKLHQAGLDVMVVDRTAFPRDKVCAGWITPQVVTALNIDCDDYRHGRTFQPIAGFRTGMIGGTREIETTYDRPVSFGIRRCEFDHYLLQRSGARLRLSTAVSSICRDGVRWIVNGSITTTMLIGAGGHFCPVARYLNPVLEGAPLVVAHESEFPLEPEEAACWATAPEIPELYFSRDLNGYGWLFRKGQYLNIGIGRLERKSLRNASAEFVAFLRARARVPVVARWQWRGHAYLISDKPRRRAVDAGVLLTGDAAGLAYPQSGEGIRPAIESGLIAASAVIEAQADYSRERLAAYDERLRDRFRIRDRPQVISDAMPASLTARLIPWLLGREWFTRHVVLDRWFLHAHDPALALRDRVS